MYRVLIPLFCVAAVVFSRLELRLPDLNRQWLDPGADSILTEAHLHLHDAFQDNRPAPKIFLLGNSAVQGKPEVPETAIAAHMNRCLSPEHGHVENLALAGGKAYSIFYVFQEVVKLKPDVLLVGITPRNFMPLTPDPEKPDTKKVDSGEHGAFKANLHTLWPYFEQDFVSFPLYRDRANESAVRQAFRADFFPTNIDIYTAQRLRHEVEQFKNHLKRPKYQPVVNRNPTSQVIRESLWNRMRAKKFNPQTEPQQFWNTFYPLDNPSFKSLPKMAQLAEQYGSRLVIFVQPQPREFLDDFYGPESQYLQQFRQKIREELVNHPSVTILDYSDMLPAMPYFEDYLHMRTDGNRLLGERLVHDVLAQQECRP